jgi:hypothetical protein
MHLCTSMSNYCREIEAHLCRKNDGHLVRIVGPAFDLVAGWETRGIPVKVACAGVDRYFERYYRKGPRRRPVRIEFCDADVLDAFDAWRRAVGVSVPAAGTGTHSSDANDGESDEAGPARRRSSLASHVERAIARLTALQASSQSAALFRGALEHAARELDVLLPDARRARGEARDSLLDRLRSIDVALMAAVGKAIDEPTRSAAEAEARAALAPFRDRMPPEAFRRATTAAVEQQIRDRVGLPSLAFD